MTTGSIIGSMLMCLLMGACAILTEALDFMPENISDRNCLAIIVFWGLFVVSAVGVAATGTF